MNLNLTKHAVDALNAASSCARQLGHDHVGAEHIFLSVLAIPACSAAQRLVALGLALDDLTASMKAVLSGGDAGVLQRGPLPLTARTKKILAATPMGRFGQAEELLGAVLFLLNDEAASFVTGVVIPVDGGYLVK